MSDLYTLVAGAFLSSHKNSPGKIIRLVRSVFQPNGDKTYGNETRPRSIKVSPVGHLRYFLKIKLTIFTVIIRTGESGNDTRWYGTIRNIASQIG